MADFVQTMKDWRRMCIAANDGPDTNKCGNCPMGETRMCAFEISDIGDYELQEAETIITTWAAEHPEPKYPTWQEWLHDLGLIVQKDGTFTEYGPNEIFSTTKKVDALTIKGYQSIPVDLAQKLGLKPKEG